MKIMEEGTDVLYEEQLFHGVAIKAASRRKLIELCVGYFQDSSCCDLNPFVRVFFLTYHWYMKTEELLQQFVTMLDERNGNTATNSSFRCNHFYHVVKYWLDNHGSDFEGNENALYLLNIFNGKLHESANGDNVDNVNNLCPEMLNLNDWYKVNVSSKTNYETNGGSNEKKSLDFNLLNGETIAELILFLNWKSLIQIPIWEWRNYGKSANTSQSPYLKEQILLFNDISKYVIGMSLNHSSADKRSLSVHKFVVASKHLKEMNDYNTLLAVVGGLGHSAITRLHKTREYLSMEDRLFIKEMHDFLTSDNNYCKYRTSTENIDGFIVPILGVVMKDLISLETAVSDFVKHDNKELINFHKLVQVTKILDHILQATSIHPNICPREDYLSILRVSLKSRYNEDSLYELSLEREPRRGSTSSTLCMSSVSSEGTEFAEWATCDSDALPSREVVESHVREMVNVVFDTYDMDRNNYINKEEFDALATNFSFIDSFAVLDVNGDSNISREEMFNYFMKANAQEMTQEFRHDFQEASYFSPHNCVYCTGFLWGMGKVGYKCKICHISCHKDCKNRVVLECRASRQTGTLGRNEKNRKGILKRIKSLDKEWKNSSDSLHDLSSSQNSLLSSSPQTPRAYMNGDIYSSPTHDVTHSLTISKLTEKILKLEEENLTLIKENQELRSSGEVSESRINMLQNQLDSVRNHSIQFMVEQMERLHSCRETEV